MRYYEVAPTKIVRANANSFTYSSNSVLTIGAFVMIPLGKQTLLGVVIKEVARPTYETKEISNPLDIPSLPEQLLQTALWMSNYYHTHLATVFQTILPRGLTKSRRLKQRSSIVHERDRTNFFPTDSFPGPVPKVPETEPQHRSVPAVRQTADRSFH